MNTLAEAVDDYVSMRRGLGFKLTQIEPLLKDFAAFMHARDKSWVTIDLAVSWAVQPAKGQPGTWAKRLAAVRCFALYRSATDARTEIPEQALLPNRRRRAKPYFYSDSEIANLLAAASALKSDRGLCGQTYCCLLGLLAVSGLRISEAVGLQNRDVNLEQGWLTIRGAKFGKSRLVPMHQSTRDVLGRYANRRDTEFPRPVTNRFFRSEQGTALDIAAVRRTFQRLCVQTGLRRSEDRKGPRLHDFRHNSGRRIIPAMAAQGRHFLENRGVVGA